jgi:hypothetical protein
MRGAVALAYTPEELAFRYKISVQQAQRYIRRFGSSRMEIDMLLAAKERTPHHRDEEMERTLREVTFG